MKPTTFFYAILLVLLPGCTRPMENTEINISIEFPFNASNVKVHVWSPYSAEFSMIEMGSGRFMADLPYGNEMLINVNYDLPEYAIVNWWAAAGIKYTGNMKPNRFDPHGIKYARIRINNQEIDHRFVVPNSSGDGLNIAFTFDKKNMVVPKGGNQEIITRFDDRVPSEVHHRFKYHNTSYPLSDDIDVAGWMNAITGENLLHDCKIEIDYVRLYGRTGNQVDLLAENEYFTFSSTIDGGLYLRYPYFPKGYDEHDPMPGNASEGVLTIYPLQTPDKVWHWWTPHHLSYSGFRYDSYVMVCRLRIQGNVIVQAGIDFKDRRNTTHELGCSDWHFENGGNWQEVVFDTHPDFFND